MRSMALVRLREWLLDGTPNPATFENPCLAVCNQLWVLFCGCPDDKNPSLWVYVWAPLCFRNFHTVLEDP